MFLHFLMLRFSSIKWENEASFKVLIKDYFKHIKCNIIHIYTKHSKHWIYDRCHYCSMIESVY